MALSFVDFSLGCARTVSSDGIVITTTVEPSTVAEETTATTALAASSTAQTTEGSTTIGTTQSTTMSSTTVSTTTSTSTTTAAPEICEGDCMPLTTVDTDFTEFGGPGDCCFGYRMSMLTLTEPIIMDTSADGTCSFSYNCADTFEYKMSIGQNQGMPKSCTIFADLPFAPFLTNVACDRPNMRFVAADAPTVSYYAYACLNIPPGVEQDPLCP
ncbi:hypothetical protein WR25_02739 [Diploscapter pachys]|uniref:Uncharacterized protein n=1 Tax=Diploscapter pachys TaxID=2018661 RepID=A0A2A2L2A4_9BILA|nr:hypothetical protein WR25_02739 [Diploscapter pachys]